MIVNAQAGSEVRAPCTSAPRARGETRTYTTGLFLLVRLMLCAESNVQRSTVRGLPGVRHREYTEKAVPMMTAS
eukprot:8139633-Pyramimonas_sp.AAC.1